MSAVRPKPLRATILEDVEVAIEEALPVAHDASAVLPGIGRALALAGGKRIRPLLCARYAETLGVPSRETVTIAAAVELIHTASLLHDDVVDEARTRRGSPTANARLGNPVAVLGGDHVLVRALRLLAPLGPGFVNDAFECIDAMTVGALIEVRGRNDASFSLRDWRRMADGKTGALFRLCGRLIARLGGQEDRMSRWGQAGARLGVGFQIADDVRDLLPAQGKDRFQDLVEKNPSFVSAAAVEAEPAFGVELARAWAIPDLQPSSVEGLAARMVSLGACARAVRDAKAEVQLARVDFGPDAQVGPIAELLAEADSALAMLDGVAAELPALLGSGSIQGAALGNVS